MSLADLLDELACEHRRLRFCLVKTECLWLAVAKGVLPVDVAAELAGVECWPEGFGETAREWREQRDRREPLRRRAA